MGTKSGRVSIGNNDGDENPFDFPITGTVGTAPPGIVVRWGIVNITDGQSQAIDFGRVIKALDPVSRTFTVQNTGGQTLTLGAVSVSAGYTLTGRLSGSLGPGQQDTFTVRLDTASAGTKSGQISFASNVSGKNPFNFPVKGVVLSPLPVAYVDGDSTCANPDGSQGCPLRTFCDGYTAVVSGGTVRLHTGTYTLCRARLTKPARFESYGGRVLLRLPTTTGGDTGGLEVQAEQPQLGPPMLRTDGSVLMRAAVLPEMAHQVFTSTNLLDWEFVQEITPEGSELDLAWPDATNEPARFFKLVVP